MRTKNFVVMLLSLSIGIVAVNQYAEQMAIAVTQSFQQPLIQIGLTVVSVILIVACSVIANKYLPRGIA